MARTSEEEEYLPESKPDSPMPATSATSANKTHCRPEDAEATLKLLEGRWKMVILFHLFAQPVQRFSELERTIPAVTQKMLIQQLRELERDGIVLRTVYPQVPPRVEYSLTEWGLAMYPALDALLKWASLRP
jgi:DNA-binding HxlR family transcriptional regulator